MIFDRRRYGTDNYVYLLAEGQDAALAGPAALDPEPQHLAVERLAAAEVGALDRHVVVRERHRPEPIPGAGLPPGDDRGRRPAAGAC